MPRLVGDGHCVLDAPRLISGHLHPALRAGNRTAPCFLLGPSRIVLPAFSPDAAGWDVAAGAIAPDLHIESLTMHRRRRRRTPRLRGL